MARLCREYRAKVTVIHDTMDWPKGYTVTLHPMDGPEDFAWFKTWWRSDAGPHPAQSGEQWPRVEIRLESRVIGDWEESI